MRKFIFRRLLSLIPIVLGATFVTFLIISLTPGDFVTSMSLNPEISPHTITKLRHDFGLDQPWYVQYGLWLYRLSPIQLPIGLKVPDLGYSFANKTPVVNLIGQRILNTLILSMSAEFLIWTIGIPLGVIAAVKRRTWIDRLSSFGVYLGISIPEILLALAAMLFAATTGWFPIGGMHTLGYEDWPLGAQLRDLLHHLVLPASVLAVTGTAGLMRYMRGSLLETLGSDYVRTARAKGVSENRAVLRHAFPNAINPIITIFGISFANLISNSFLVEVIMGWPGLGRLAYEAILAKDLYVIMASLLMATLFLVIGNLLADILLGLTDPRIRYE
jgi:peptide/nickel transport system permease protein